MKVFSLFIIACLIAGTLTGCKQTTARPATATSAAATTGTDDLASLLISPAMASHLQRRIQWMQTLRLGRHEKYHCIVAQPDLLMVLESDNLLSVIDAATGQVRWRKQVAAPITRLFAPTRLDQRLVVNSESHVYVYHLPTGHLNRRVDLPAVASTGAVLIGDLAVFGSPTGKVFALNLRSGLTEWAYQMRGALLVSPVLVDKNTIVVADSFGVVKAISARGKLLWARAAPPWKRISAQPQAGTSAVYIASEDQSLYGIDRITGNMWHYLAAKPLTESPVVIGERVFLSVPGQGLLCFDAVTGDRLWESPVVGRPLLIRKNRLLVHHEKQLLLLESKTGKTIETLDLPKADRIVTDNPVGGTLYLFNNDGRILKLAPLP